MSAVPPAAGQAAPSEVFIFPLATVLFPGAVLPLKVFEQRYIELTKICLRDERPFGVCLIREGQEVGAPAVPEAVGCLAHIVQWDMPQMGLFALETRGGNRLRILEHHAAANGLIHARIELLPVPDADEAPDAELAGLLQELMARVGRRHFPEPHRFDSADWVSYRLAEILPLPLSEKQALLEADTPAGRMARLRTLLRRED